MDSICTKPTSDEKHFKIKRRKGQKLWDEVLIATELISFVKETRMLRNGITTRKFHMWNIENHEELKIDYI